jgi:N-acetylglucosaminyldiphosphoundecaprenol N-acetyl-beta-D-mannosaminyltransferase
MSAVFVVTGEEPTCRPVDPFLPAPGSRGPTGSIAQVPPTPAQWTTARPFEFSGVTLLDTDVAGAVAALAAASRAGEPQGLHLCNAFTLALASRDPAYRETLLHAGAVNLPDGVPVAWYYRLANREHARGPVRGPGLMRAALEEPGLRHFLLGGTEEVLADLTTEILSNHPHAVLAGSLAPPFRDPDDADVEGWAATIRASGAQVTWIGLGTPRQDRLIARLTGRTGSVLVGVGAAFDFLSGHKAEAPALLHGTGLEWVYRLVSEPRRLWRRYLFGNAAFVAEATRQLAVGRRRRVSR